MAWTTPVTQPTGVLITAAIWNAQVPNNMSYLHDKGVLTIFDSTVVGSPVASIDIPGIVATYADLELEIRAFGTAVAPTSVLGIRLNGDAGSNYYAQLLGAHAASVTTAENLAITYLSLGDVPALNSLNTGSVMVDIPDYTQTGSRHTFQSRWVVATAGTTGTTLIGLGGGFWDDSGGAAAAINRISLLLSAGSFAVGTRVILRAKGSG